MRTDSRDDQGRPNCDECRFQLRGSSFPNESPCAKGKSALFTCCVTNCPDFKRKEKERCSSETT